MITADPIKVRPAMHAQANNTSLPAWVRLHCWTWANADHHGHARAAAGQMRRELNLTDTALSQAIRQARHRGLLDPASSARCAVLPGHGLAPCSATHRGGL